MLVLDGEPSVLVASGLGERTGGGVAAWYGAAVEALDAVSSCGLAHRDGRLVRVLLAEGLAGRSSDGELAIYDAGGLRQYLRVDGVSDLHDVAWDGEQLVVVSTGTNAIVWLDLAGRVTRTWQAPGRNDAWHLNCVVRHRGRWYAMAFCRAPDHRAWFAPSERERGVLFDLETGKAVAEGLSSPHSPRHLDGAWVVADSGRRRLVALDPATGRVMRETDVGGWSRGLAWTDRHLFVGISAPRGEAADARARIVVVDRETWRVEERVPLPWDEVYDLLTVPASVVDGLRRGCDTNPLRVAEARQPRTAEGLLWTRSPPPDPARCRAQICADLPETLVAGATVELPCIVKNTGEESLATLPPDPVELTYNWREPDTRAWLERDEDSPLQSVRSRIPSPVAPGEATEARVRIEAPLRPGRWLLTVTLLDERIGWFDEFPQPSGTSRVVEVLPPTEVRGQDPRPHRLRRVLHRIPSARPTRRSAPAAPS